MKSAVLAASLLVCTTALAQETAPVKGDIGGSARLSYWSSDRSLNEHRGAAVLATWLNGKVEYRDTRFVFDGWVAAVNADGTAQQDKVREAYADRRFGDCSARLGRQIISWGRADGINPTDRISPRDYTLLAPEEADNQSGADGLQMRCDLDAGTFSAGTFTRFAGNTVPLPVRPGLQYQPARSAGPMRTALKYERNNGALDWSVSLYHGADTLPETAAVALGAGGVSASLKVPTVRVLGHDGSWALSGPLAGTVMRWEAAYTKAVTGEGQRANNLMAVIGAEVGLDAGATVSAQWIGQRWGHFVAPDMSPASPAGFAALLDAPFSHRFDRVSHGAMLRWRKPWHNDMVVTDLTLVYDVTRGSRMLRGKATYAINDHWRLVGSFDHFAGNELSSFGVLKQNNLLMAEVRRLF
ncbi:MAG: hypothetical protein V4631_18145 [Pseudomonadota bacterium]